jgi:ACS family hexuronate transporter-like MFS transporter
MALFIPALCALPVCLAAVVDNVWISTIVVGIAAAANQASAANGYSLTSDIMPKNYVSSMVGMAGFIGGIVGPLVAKLIGYVLTIPHGYVYLFQYSSVAYLIAFAILHFGIPKIEPYKAPEIATEAA